MPVLMKCGHVATGRLRGEPVCVACLDLTTLADEIADHYDLSGREAVCVLCDQVANSSLDLPHFQYRPAMQTDRFYCGCNGWG